MWLLRRLPHPCITSPLLWYFSLLSPWSERVYCAWHVLPCCVSASPRMYTVHHVRCGRSHEVHVNIVWRGHALRQSVMRSVPWVTRVWSVVCSMSSLSWAVHQVWGRRHVRCFLYPVCCVMGVAVCSVTSICFTGSFVLVLPWRRLLVQSGVCYLWRVCLVCVIFLSSVLFPCAQCCYPSVCFPFLWFFIIFLSGLCSFNVTPHPCFRHPSPWSVSPVNQALSP